MSHILFMTSSQVCWSTGRREFVIWHWYKSQCPQYSAIHWHCRGPSVSDWIDWSINIIKVLCYCMYFNIHESDVARRYHALCIMISSTVCWNTERLEFIIWRWYTSQLYKNVQERKVWAFSFSPWRPSRHSCASYRQWWKCEWIVFARNCCDARMLPREVELVPARTGLPGGEV